AFRRRRWFGSLGTGGTYRSASRRVATPTATVQNAAAVEHLLIHLALHLPGLVIGFLIGVVILLALDLNDFLSVLVVAACGIAGMWAQDKFQE
ncbi:MAG TPA: hypothetical protein VFI90_13755, partial [Rubrobacter sp.]|nr:hypothetical protein [Rubrobacter sp.]